MFSLSRGPLVWSDTAPRKAYRPRLEGTRRLYTPPFKDNRRCIRAEETLHAAALPEAKCDGHQVCLRISLKLSPRMWCTTTSTACVS